MSAEQKPLEDKPDLAKSAPLSIHPDPSYFVEGATNPFSRICRVIDVSDGGVIGVTGERGAGKSVLLNKIDDQYKSRNLTVKISSPISESKEMEFFLMLFRNLVQRVIVDLRRRIEAYRDEISSIGKRARWREWQLLISTSLLIMAALSLAFLWAWSLRITEGRSDFAHTMPAVSLSPLRVFVLSVFAPLSVYPSALFWATLLAALVLLAQPHLRRYWLLICASHLERGLLIYSESIAAKLDYELTRTTERGLEFAPRAWLKGTAKKSTEEKPRAISLPELTSNYIDFVTNVLRVYPDKLIVCIDELDKVSDLDQIRFILREIKGALYVRGTFYLLSISNDALRSFEGRMGDQRDIFESTFDDVFPVRSLDLETCIEILRKRMDASGEMLHPKTGDDATLGAIAVFSAGNARDLIRGFRECVLSGEPGTLPTAPDVWRLLCARRLESINDRAAVAGGSHDIRSIFLPLSKMTPDELRTQINRISSVRTSLRQFATASGLEAEDAQVAQRFIRYSAEIEIMIRAGVALHALDNWRKAAAYLMSAYQILPFSLSDCEALLESYGDYMDSEAELPMTILAPTSPLEKPISDRAMA